MTLDEIGDRIHKSDPSNLFNIVVGLFLYLRERETESPERERTIRDVYTAEWKGELDALRSDLERVTKERDGYRAAVGDVAGISDEWKDDYKDTRKCLLETQKERDQLRADLAEVTKERDLLQDRICKATRAWVEANQDRDQLRAELEKATNERNDARLTIASSLAPATFDAIATLCGCPQWDYPGQIVRDVERVVKERDDLLEKRRRSQGNCIALECEEKRNQLRAELAAQVTMTHDVRVKLGEAEAAVAREREACAKECEDFGMTFENVANSDVCTRQSLSAEGLQLVATNMRACAARIRARKTEER